MKSNEQNLLNNVLIDYERHLVRPNGFQEYADSVLHHVKFDAFEHILVRNRMVFEIVEIYFVIE